MRPEVWAPRARRVEVVLADGSRHRLEPDAGGWHRGGPELGHGDTYRFALDGRSPLPDPRSHHQPAGIDGPSAVVDHGRFRWSDAGWRGFHLPGSVLYELHVGTFTPDGTFDAAIERLDHLVELGVDAVEVMPVAEAMGRRGWGYDGVLLWAAHHALGGPDGFSRFVDACHARGLGVVLDVVHNHLGPKGNHLERFGPYFTDRHRTPWGPAVNLDGEGSHEVRAFLAGNARHWFVDHHVDGLRLDATHALADDSPTPFLAELAEEVTELGAHLGRRLWLVAEDERDDPAIVAAREAGGLGLDARWADDLHHALHVAVTGERQGYYARFQGLARVAAAIRGVHGKPGAAPVPDEIPSHRFVTCVQNHDQVGNRARGERLAHLAGAAAQTAAATVLLCAPGTPLVFMGEEWAASTPFPYFVDVPDDPDLATAVRDGRRVELARLGWAPEDVPDPTDEATFRAAVLRWDERDRGEHAAVLAHYRALLALRRARPDLTDGRRHRTDVAVRPRGRGRPGGVVAVRRARTTAVANLAPEPATWEVAGDLLLANLPGVALDGRALRLPPWGAAVLATPGGGFHPVGCG